MNAQASPLLSDCPGLGPRRHSRLLRRWTPLGCGLGLSLFLGEAQPQRLTPFVNASVIVEGLPGLTGSFFAPASVGFGPERRIAGGLLLSGPGVTADNDRALVMAEPGQPLRLIIREGDAVEGDGLPNGVTFVQTQGDLYIDSSGNVAFRADVAGLIGEFSPRMVVLWGPPGDLRVVAFDEQDLSSDIGSGYVLTINDARMNRQGTLAYHGSAFHPTAPSGDAPRQAAIWSGPPGAATVAVRTENPVVGGGPATYLGSIHGFALGEDDSILYTGNYGSGGFSVLHLKSGGNLLEIGRGGDPAPGLPEGVLFDHFNTVNLFVGDNGVIGFQAALKGQEFTGQGISAYYLGQAGSPKLIVREGAMAPDANGDSSPGNGLAPFKQAQFRFAPNGRAVLRASIDTGSTANDTGVWYWDGANLLMLMREGEPAPGFPGATWQQANATSAFFEISPDGNPVVGGRYRDSAGGQQTTVFTTDSSGNLQPMFRPDEPIDLGTGGFQTLRNASLPATAGVNDEGLVPISANTATGTALLGIGDSNIIPAPAGSGRTISGWVWYDRDLDGSVDTEDRETPFVGVTMELYADPGDGNPVGNPLRTVQIDSSLGPLRGSYSIPDVPPGSYLLKAVLIPEWEGRVRFTAPDDGTATFPLVAGTEPFEVDFLIGKLITIAGRIAEDRDRDQEFSEGDVPILDHPIRVELYFDGDRDGFPDGPDAVPWRTTIASLNGSTLAYEFRDLLDEGRSRYVVRAPTPPGYVSVWEKRPSGDPTEGNDDLIPVHLTFRDSIDDAHLSLDNDFLERRSGVTLTMHRVLPENIANLDRSVDQPLIPADPRSKDHPEIDSGLVADGVTPLLIKIQGDPEFLSSPVDLYIRRRTIRGGELDPSNTSELWVNPSALDWEKASQEPAELSPSEGLEAYAYMGAIRTEDLQLAPGSQELELRIEVGRSFSPDAEASLTVRIRKPPINLHAHELFRHDFLATLHQSRAESFVIQSPFDVSLEDLREHWAVTLVDVVAQGSAALTVYGLLKEFPSPYLKRENYFRGWHRRIVMIGAPHNGSRLGAYLFTLAGHLKDTLQANPDLPLLDQMVPSILQDIILPRENPSSENFNYDPLNPASSLVTRSLKQHSKESFPQSRLHLVATDVDPNNVAYRFLGLTGDRLARVLPLGSDGLVDRRSALALEPSPDTSLAPWLIVEPPEAHPDSRRFFSTPRIAHRASSLFSYRRPGDEQLTRVDSQTTSGELAGHIVSMLDSPNSADYFSSLKDLRDGLEPLSQNELEDIEVSAGSLIIHLQTLLNPVETQSNLRPQNTEISKADVTEQFYFRIDPPPNAPIADEVIWIAEVFGTNGVSVEGVTLIPGGNQGESVTVEFATGLVGDLVLYGSYLTPDGTLVYAVPKLVASYEPMNAILAGIEVLPTEATIAPGERLRPELWAIYSDGTRARRYPTGDHFTVTSSSPLVVDASIRSEWSGLAEGTATVTVNFAGMSADSQVTVLNPFPPQTFQEWKAAHFTTEELADPAISGDQADFDGDGLTTLFEYVTGADPVAADPEHRLWAALRSDAGELKPVLLARLSATLAGMEASIENSTDLLQWDPYYELSGEPGLDDPVILDYANAGSHYQIWFDLPMASPGSSHFYRLSVKATP